MAALVVAAIGIVRDDFCRIQTERKAGSICPSMLWSGAAETHCIDWSKPAKDFLMRSDLCNLQVFISIELPEGIPSHQLSGMEPFYLFKNEPDADSSSAIPYVLIIFTVMFIGNMNHRVLPSTGDARKDMWIAGCCKYD